MKRADDKQLFAPAPLRAIALDLSGLQLRVLLCVAAHDRLSLPTGKGQGCRASNDRMRQMVGCHYSRLCSTLSQLVSLGLLQREKLGRHSVYRVVYTNEDRLLFSNRSPPAAKSAEIGQVSDQKCDSSDRIGFQTASEALTTCCHGLLDSGEFPPNTAQQYIPLNGGIHSEESGEYNSSEEARLASLVPEDFGGGGEKNRPKAGRSRIAFAKNVGGQMAVLERALSTGHPVNKLAWYEWLGDNAVCHENRGIGGQAIRLADQLVDLMDGPEYQQWQERYGPASIGMQEAVHWSHRDD